MIGSGAGGLTAAVALARAGKRVLVLEQHYLPGGWCHSFSLGGYRFSPGVHYIGALGEGGRMRQLYEGLGLGADLTFYELRPDAMDHVLIGHERFDIPKGKAAFAERLARRCPQDSTGIIGYLDAVERMQQDLLRIGRAKSAADFLSLPFRARTALRWGYRSAGAMLDHYVKDPFAKAVLSAQAGDHGLPPSMVAAPIHALVTAHYFDGGYYPKGGAAALPRAYLRELRRRGGKIRVRTAVDKILLEGRRAVGVRLLDGEEIRARHVVSNADPHVTYERLVGRDRLGWGLRRKLSRTVYSGSCLSLFGATDLDLSALGLDSGNYWLYKDVDVDRAYRLGLTGWDEDIAELPPVFFTVTSLKDPSKRVQGRPGASRKGRHTFEAFTFVGYDAFRRWVGTPCGDRPDDYQRRKEKLQARLLAEVERVAPGISEHLAFAELGTPLSNQFYVAATGGSLYGTAKTPAQFGPRSFPVATPFSNLWLCGASTIAHGVMGSAMSGLMAAARILGCRTRDLLARGEAPITVRGAEEARAELAASGSQRGSAAPHVG